MDPTGERGRVGLTTAALVILLVRPGVRSFADGRSSLAASNPCTLTSLPKSVCPRRCSQVSVPRSVCPGQCAQVRPRPVAESALNAEGTGAPGFMGASLSGRYRLLGWLERRRPARHHHHADDGKQTTRRLHTVKRLVQDDGG